MIQRLVVLLVVVLIHMIFKIEKALAKNDEGIMNKKTEYERKQKYAEEMRNKFHQEKLQKAKEQETKNKQKEAEILEVLKRNDEILQKRIDDYNKKQKEIAERQKRLVYLKTKIMGCTNSNHL